MQHRLVRTRRSTGRPWPPEGGETFILGSITGTMLNCHADELTSVGDYKAVRPSVADWACVYG